MFSSPVLNDAWEDAKGGSEGNCASVVHIITKQSCKIHNCLSENCLKYEFWLSWQLLYQGPRMPWEKASVQRLKLSSKAQGLGLQSKLCCYGDFWVIFILSTSLFIPSYRRKQFYPPHGREVLWEAVSIYICHAIKVFIILM